MAKKTPIIENRKAYHNYYIEQKYNAGLVLHGTEVKSIRLGKVNFADSFCMLIDGELWVRGMHIAEYVLGTTNNHLAVHDRKLLLTKKELKKIGLLLKENNGLTIVPLKIFFNEGNYAKLEIGMAKGKKLHDKRETNKEADAKREIQRYLKK
jgi:SsrA-binding protein